MEGSLERRVVPCLYCEGKRIVPDPDSDLAKYGHTRNCPQCDATGMVPEFAEEWAERLAEMCSTYKAAFDAFMAVVSESYGVAGLHLNGDIAPWNELLNDGYFSEWLEPMVTNARLLAAEKAVENESAR